MDEGVEGKKDEEIAHLVQDDNIELFEVLIERYELKIKRYAKKFLSDKEDINDVVQEIFIKAYRNIESFDVKRKFSSWLYRIAHNELVNALKKKKKRVSTMLDLDLFLPYYHSNEDIEGKIDRKGMQELINKSLDNLEFKYQEPLILYYFEGLSYKEIADVMEIPVSTVGIRIKRAKEKIKSICRKLEPNNI